MPKHLQNQPEEQSALAKRQAADRRILLASITISGFIILVFTVLCICTLIFGPEVVTETLEEYNMPNLADLMRRVSEVMSSTG